ncbi:AP2 domain transcription factor AP2VIII-6 [Toxoplasma gondii RUB]|uniref:AP2 domain transcription factor AP2VIII-6 n=1 Tax=Toxoplasma gondii RUB TaxID=935652 RepID=A0A086LYG1_TOXGO|nr:AP2 domain transcription factor AP2VIII-6 [Toxoplasma gondii RUB]
MARNAPPVLTSPDVFTSACFSPSRHSTEAKLSTLGKPPPFAKAGDSTCAGSPSLSPTPLTSPGASSCASAFSVLSSPVSAASDFSTQPRELCSTPHAFPTWPVSYATPEPALPLGTSEEATASCGGSARVEGPAKMASEMPAERNTTAEVSETASVSIARDTANSTCDESRASSSPHFTVPHTSRKGSKEPGMLRRRGREPAAAEKVGGGAAPRTDSPNASAGLRRSMHSVRVSCSDSSRSTTTEAGAELVSSHWERQTSGAVTPSSGTNGGKGLPAVGSPDASEGDVSLDTTDNSGESTVSTSQTIRSSRSASRKSSVERGAEAVGAVCAKAVMLPIRAIQRTDLTTCMRKNRERGEGTPANARRFGVGEGEWFPGPVPRGHTVGIDGCTPRANPFVDEVDSPSAPCPGAASELFRSLASGLILSIDGGGEDAPGSEDELISFERLESFCDAVRTPTALRISGASLSTDSSDVSEATQLGFAGFQSPREPSTPQSCCGTGSAAFEAREFGRRLIPQTLNGKAAQEEGQKISSVMGAGEKSRMSSDDGAPESKAAVVRKNVVYIQNLGSRRGEVSPMACEKRNAVLALPRGPGMEDTEAFAEKKRLPVERGKREKEPSLFCCACCGGRLLCSQCSATSDVHGIEPAGYGASNPSLQRLQDKATIGRRNGANARESGALTPRGQCRVCAESIYCGFCVYRMQATVSVSCAPASDQLAGRSPDVEGPADALLRRHFSNGAAVEEGLDGVEGSGRESEVGATALCMQYLNLNPGCRQGFPCVPPQFGEAEPETAAAWFSGTAGQETKQGIMDVGGGPQTHSTSDMLVNGLGFLASCPPSGADFRGAAAGHATHHARHFAQCQRQACRSVVRGKSFLEGDPSAGLTECGPLIGLDGIIGRAGSLGMAPLQGDTFTSPQVDRGAEQGSVPRHAWACAGRFPIPGGFRFDKTTKTDSSRKPNSPQEAWKQGLVPTSGAWSVDANAATHLCSTTQTSLYRDSWDWASLSSAADACLQASAGKTSDSQVAMETAGVNRAGCSGGLASNSTLRAGGRFGEAAKSLRHCLPTGRENPGVKEQVALETEAFRTLANAAEAECRFSSLEYTRLAERAQADVFSGAGPPAGMLSGSGPYGRSVRWDVGHALGVSRRLAESAALAAHAPHPHITGCPPDQHGNSGTPVCDYPLPQTTPAAAPLPSLRPRPSSEALSEAAFPRRDPGQLRGAVQPREAEKRSWGSAERLEGLPCSQTRYLVANSSSPSGRSSVHDEKDGPDSAFLRDQQLHLSAETAGTSAVTKRRRVDRATAGRKDSRGDAGAWGTPAGRVMPGRGPGTSEGSIDMGGFNDGTRCHPRRSGTGGVHLRQAVATGERRDTEQRRPIPPDSEGGKPGVSAARKQLLEADERGKVEMTTMRSRKRCTRKQVSGDAHIPQETWPSSPERSRMNAEVGQVNEPRGVDSGARFGSPARSLESELGGDERGSSGGAGERRATVENSQDLPGFACSRHRGAEEPGRGSATSGSCMRDAGDLVTEASRHALARGRQSTESGSIEPAEGSASTLACADVISSRRRTGSSRFPSRATSRPGSVSPGVKTSKRRRGDKGSTNDELAVREGEELAPRLSGPVGGVTQEAVQEESPEGQTEPGEGNEQGMLSGDKGGAGPVSLDDSEKTETQSAEKEAASPPGRGSNGRFWRAGGDGRVLYDQSGQKISGIWFDSGRRLWRVVFTQGERRRTKGFSLRQYGFEEARNMAVQCKLEMEARKGEKTSNPVSPAK